MQALLLAWLLGAPPVAPSDCFTAAEAAFLAGRLGEASRLYREAADLPTCAADAPLLRLNGALALSRTLDGSPHETYCAVARELGAALAQGLPGGPRRDAEDQRARADRLCRTSRSRGILTETRPADARTLPAAPEASDSRVRLLDISLQPLTPIAVVDTAVVPPVQALLPDARAASAPDVERGASGPYVVGALAAGSASAVAAAAMLVLSLEAQAERTSAGEEMIRVAHRPDALNDARDRYSAADRDVVESGAWFYGLSGAACVLLTTALTLWLFDDEPAPATVARVDEGGR